MPDGRPDLQGTYDFGTSRRSSGRKGIAAGADRRRSEETRGAGRRRSVKADAPIDASRAAPPIGRRRIAGAVRQRRRLQQFLARSRLAVHDGRWPEARVAADRSAGRPRPAADRVGAEAQRVARAARPRPTDEPGRRSRLRRRRRLRRSRAAAARRALHHRVRLDVGAADPADLLLQQPPPDRADAGHGR